MTIEDELLEESIEHRRIHLAGKSCLQCKAAAEIARLKAENEDLAKKLSRATGRQRVSIVDQDGNEVGYAHRSMEELLRTEAWREEETTWLPPTAWAYFAVCRARDAKQALIAEMREGLERLKQWTETYPVDVFPEPDLDTVKEILADHGYLNQMDRMHASWGRRILSGIASDVSTLLKSSEAGHG